MTRNLLHVKDYLYLFWNISPTLRACLHLNLSTSAQDGEGAPVDVQVKDNGNGTYACSYTPRKPVKHTAMISWGGVNIPDSPFRVSTQGEGCSHQDHFYKERLSWAFVFWLQMNIGAGCHPNKVKVSGPGVAKTGLKAFEPTYFTVDCSEAGQGKATINCSSHDLFEGQS